MSKARPANLRELRDSGYRPVSVREELRRNLLRRLAKGEDILPGIIGYEDTVKPQLQNALLSGQDIILLGERGQAKSRIIRSLTCLLDDMIPIIKGTDIPEEPFRPVSARGRALAAEKGDALPIDWLPRDARYGEKLATPDITMADLIGEVDPIKVAAGRLLSDEETIHFGLIPRTNRGIFAINELPDLAERIQVGLLNVMEERDVQIRGHRIRLELDLLLIASANPEDYTNRGCIITPLKDRYGAQIRTHYPRSIEHEIAIMERERSHLDMGEYRTRVPAFMQEIIAEISHLARQSPDINQRSGVSVRASIASYEAILANALRRAVRTGEMEVVPRISDLPFALPTLQGKVEFEVMQEDQEEKLLGQLFQEAVHKVFRRYSSPVEMQEIALQFADGLQVVTGEALPSRDYAEAISKIEGMEGMVEKLASEQTDGVRASTLEFILEGLHLHELLNRDQVDGTSSYSS